MKHFIDAGLQLLPKEMDTDESRAMLFAIGFQESQFKYRKQIRGPARSFWQFESIGVKGVIEHPTTSYFAQVVLDRLYINKEDVFEAITFSDALASAFARLNLWKLPDALPNQKDALGGWIQYVKAWRPGKPHPEKWFDNFNQGWEAVLMEGIE